MSQRIRTFIAVEADPAIRGAAQSLIHRLQASGGEVKWVAPENLHLTLKFLGDVAANDVAQVCAAVREAVAAIEPFELEMRGAGAFPNVRRPQTIWLGAEEGSDRMVKLAGRIDKFLEKLGYPRESRPYRAHLTLGRLRREAKAPPELGQTLQQFAEFEAGRMPVEEAVVFSSTLKPGGPVYEAMDRAALGGH